MKFDFKINFQKSRELVYYLCQTGGWTAYVIILLLIDFSLGHYDARNIFVTIYLGLLGLAGTHIYRMVFKKYRWIRLPYIKLTARIIFTSVIASLVIMGALFAVLTLTGYAYPRQHILSLYFVNVFYITIILIIWSLIYVAVHYFENYRASEIEKLVWEAAVKDFELRTLKSQLNPHFMFNAMNSIRSLIEENPEQAKTAVSQLSNIFRYFLQIEKIETVPLGDEIKVVEDYLGLEKVRYEERLHYELDIDPASRRVEIPPVMIQTLVENGIKHGIAKIPEGGRITIRVIIIKDTLSITIMNSGSFDETLFQNSKGFGISNTKQRLHLLYGSKASLSIGNENNFVKVNIIIPLEGTAR